MDFLACTHNPFLHWLTVVFWVSQTEWGELFNRNIKSLNTKKITDVPYFYHTCNVCCDYLRSIRQTFDSYKWMVMSSKQKNFVFDIGVPYKCLVIKPCWQKALIHWAPLAPVQRINSFVMPFELFLKLMGIGIPQTDIAPKASTGKGLLWNDRQNISNWTRMPFLLLVTLIERVPSWYCASFLQCRSIVYMDNSIWSTSVKNLFVTWFPIRITNF